MGSSRHEEGEWSYEEIEQHTHTLATAAADDAE